MIPASSWWSGGASIEVLRDGDDQGFLDIPTEPDHDDGAKRGLLSMAFDPNYASKNGC